MTHDHLDSAYATLGLSHDALPSAVKRQYRALVRKWHPDRFTGDAQGIAEATLMLKALNHAYGTIVGQHSEHAFTHEDDRGASPQSPPSHGFGDRLTQTQKDEIVEAIRDSESLLAVVFNDGVAGWRSRAASLALVAMYGVAGWSLGASAIVLGCTFPLLCIWFPDTLGEHVGGRITKTSPASFVWLFGWVVLLVPMLALVILWIRASPR